MPTIDPVRIIHHGGAGSVTGSCHRLQLVDGRALLIDCGLFQGREAGGSDSLERHRVRFAIDTVEALIVTHVHLDHGGRLPYLLAAGYRGPIVCTRASARLLPLMIEDALRVGFTDDRSLIGRCLDAIDRLVVPLPFNTWHTVINGVDRCVRVRLQPAGHLLGSALVEVDVATPDGSTRVVFSGDLGAARSLLLPPAVIPERADVLVLESTYGDRLHAPQETRQARLKAAIDHALENDGTVIVPAFSIGRTQELLVEFEDLIHTATDARWRTLAVVLDSPLAARFTAVYRALQDEWSAAARARVRAGRQPFAFENLLIVDNADQHARLVDYLARTGRPAVIIAASGMATGGRVVDYLKRMLPDPQHAVVLVGYLAPGTPGRAIADAGPNGGEVELDGERIPIRAQVCRVDGYSAHADQADLLAFVQGIPIPPQEIRLVHGETRACQALKTVIDDWATANGHTISVRVAEKYVACFKARD